MDRRSVDILIATGGMAHRDTPRRNEGQLP